MSRSNVAGGFIACDCRVHFRLPDGSRAAVRFAPASSESLFAVVRRLLCVFTVHVLRLTRQFDSLSDGILPLDRSIPRSNAERRDLLVFFHGNVRKVSQLLFTRIASPPIHLSRANILSNEHSTACDGACLVRDLLLVPSVSVHGRSRIRLESLCNASPFYLM